MKTISATAIVALMTVSVGLAAAAPALAQEGQPRFGQHLQNQGPGPHQHGHGQRPGNDGPGRGGLLGGLLEFGPNSERLELALVRLSHRLELTSEQKTLLESFRTSALAAQAEFSGVLDATRPATPDARTTPTERPDLVARLDQRIALEKAHVDALTAVQPSFEAFFASLTDAQKAQLQPQRNHRDGWQGRGGKGHGPMGNGPMGNGPMGQHAKPPMPGQADEPDSTDAPAEAPAAPAQIQG